MCVFPCFQVYIEVADVNDNLPRPGLPAYWPTLTENAPPNTEVVTISADDADPHEQVTYSIVSGNPQSLFSINENTGE